jgi:WD40 repeat protein
VAQVEVFDLFLSYNRNDASIAQRLVQVLRSRGLKVFFDRDYLTPGQAWPALLEKHLRACRAVAICLGPEGLGPWQQREQYVALDRQVQERDFPVIPLLLPGAKDPPLGFLRLSVWVDLKAGVEDWPTLNLLERAIRGQAPSPDDIGLPDPRASICPYRGLEPFREEDKAFFVGREEFTRTLLDKIAQRPLVGVVGASGSGKSSVVLAGLVPALRQRMDGRAWEIGTMRPGPHPLRQLAAVFLPPDTELDEYDRIARLKKRAERLASGEVTLADVIAAALERQAGTDRLLLIVDQWEELYTQTKDLQIEDGQNTHSEVKRPQIKDGQISSERDDFVRVLLEGVRSEARLSVVLTLRGDFYGRALQDRALSDQLQDAIVNISPMARSELTRAIVEPAENVALSFENGLVEEILNDVGNEPGNLPLLEFLLKELWDQHSPDRRLTFRSYASTGRVKRAIATRAEGELKKLSAEQQVAARRFLIRLVTPGEGQEDTRARAAIPQGDEMVRDVIDRFARARLLTTGRDPASGREIVEVAHEALIREWDTLKGWVDSDREFLRTVERVKVSMRAWHEETGNKCERLLPSGRPLEEARELLKREDAEIGDLREFIQTSIVNETARQEEERRTREEQQRKELALAKRLAEEEALRADAAETLAKEQVARVKATKRTYALSAVFAVVTLLGVAAIAIMQTQSLELLKQAQAETTQRLREAHIAQSHLLARFSQQKTASGDATAGILLALEALPRDKTDSRPVVPEAFAALMQASLSIRERAVLKHHDLVSAVALSPDGRTLATSVGDKTSLIWDVTTGQERASFSHQDLVDAVALSPDGRTLATASFDKTARIWDLASGEERILAHEDVVRAVSFSPDSRTVATGSDDKAARIWDVTTGQEHVLRGHLDTVRAAAFSPDGRVLATASDDATARIWDVKTGQQLTSLRHQDSVRAVAFSPDGRMLATASEDKTARIWDLTTGQERALAHEGVIRALAFSPDGRMLVTASLDNTIRISNVATGEEYIVLRYQGPVRAVALSPDGRTLAAAPFDKTARVWDVLAGQERVLAHRGSVSAIAFSPDGRTLATTALDKTARLWDVTTGQEGSVIKYQDLVSAVALSADGHTLATALFDKTARIWDLATGQERVLTHEAVVKSVAFSPDGRALATASLDNKAWVWDVTTGQKLAVIPHQGSVDAVALSPDRRTLATASDDKTARIWDVATGQSRVLAHEGAVKAVAFSYDGQMLATASTDNTARVWDITTGQKLALLVHQGAVSAVALSPDGRTLATASDDKTARIRNVATGQERVLPHEGVVKSVAFSPDGRMLATASDDRTARIWDVTTGQERAVLTHQGSVSTVAFSRDGRTLATASDDKTVRLVTLPPSDIFELIDYGHRKLPIGRTELSKSERETALLLPISANQ